MFKPNTQQDQSSGFQERGACSKCAGPAGRHVWLLYMLILERWVCMVVPAVWLTGASQVCSQIHYFMRLIYIFKTFRCCFYVCLKLSAYTVCFCFVCVSVYNNEFYYIIQIIILFWIYDHAYSFILFLTIFLNIFYVN